MNDLLEVVVPVILIGMGATAIMDLWLLGLKLLNVPIMNFALLGRWTGHIIRGRWFHDGMAKAEPVKRELLMGWLAHYVIGIGFAVILVAVFGGTWIRQPTFLPAFAMGIATVIAPLFIMQPAMGAGIAFSKTTAPLRSCMKSVVNHAVFGCGLYISGAALAFLQ